MKTITKIALTLSVTLSLVCGVFAARQLIDRPEKEEGAGIAKNGEGDEKTQQRKDPQPEIFTEDYYKGVKLGNKIILPANFTEIDIIESCIGYHYLAGQDRNSKALYSPAGDRLTQSIYLLGIDYEYNGHCYFQLVSLSGGETSFCLLNDRYEALIEPGYDYDKVKFFHRNLVIFYRRNGRATALNMETGKLVMPWEGYHDIQLLKEQNVFMAQLSTFSNNYIFMDGNGKGIRKADGSELLPASQVYYVTENGVQLPCCLRLVRDSDRKGESEQTLYNFETGVETPEGYVMKEIDVEEKDDEAEYYPFPAKTNDWKKLYLYGRVRSFTEMDPTRNKTKTVFNRDGYIIEKRNVSDKYYSGKPQNDLLESRKYNANGVLVERISEYNGDGWSTFKANVNVHIYDQWGRIAEVQVYGKPHDGRSIEFNGRRYSIEGAARYEYVVEGPKTTVYRNGRVAAVYLCDRYGNVLRHDYYKNGQVDEICLSRFTVNSNGEMIQHQRVKLYTKLADDAFDIQYVKEEGGNMVSEIRGGFDKPYSGFSPTILFDLNETESKRLNNMGKDGFDRYGNWTKQTSYYATTPTVREYEYFED